MNLEMGAWSQKRMKGAEEGLQVSSCLRAGGQKTNKGTQIAGGFVVGFFGVVFWGFFNYYFMYLFPPIFFSREGADSLFFFFLHLGFAEVLNILHSAEALPDWDQINEIKGFIFL